MACSSASSPADFSALKVRCLSWGLALIWAIAIPLNAPSHLVASLGYC